MTSGGLPTGATARLVDGEWHRLHWASPLLKGGFWLVAIVGFVLANLRERLVEFFIGTGPANDGGRGGGGGPGDNGDIIAMVYDRGQTGVAILVIAGILLIAVGSFAVAWRMHSFRIGADAVEVRSGVLFRHHRKARLDRLQGIHITRPLFARFFGAAKIELSVAGQDAKVELAYLGSGQVDELRREILSRASGVRAEEHSAAANAAGAGAVAAEAWLATESHLTIAGATPVRVDDGLLQRRVQELLAPELDPDTAPPESVVKITPGRLIGSLVLSEFTVVLLLVIAGLFVSTLWGHRFLVLFLLLPSVIGSLGYYWRRFSKSLRYSIAGTADGVRVGFGMFSTSNDTLPPGRIHAIEVTQPILWRPAGWWMIRINRAGHASSRSGSSQPHTLLLPVGRAGDVQKVLGLLLPGTAGQEIQQLVLAGLSARSGQGFADAPRRAFWLRPLSYRRTGMAVTSDAVLLRSGFIWRRLSVVPLARLQSLHVAQGPVRRALDLAQLQFNTIAGPVRATLGVIGRREALEAFRVLSDSAVRAAEADGSHRWAETRTRSGIPDPVVPLPTASPTTTTTTTSESPR
ncbi:PH domain-containing protein [Subtercola frigoramans]|uniref:Membrane protein n=1 Tax=Subtercola frigoramans TaxID=120298 RepID=A0ABS2L233_9MICO|nr:PH domain-containing protein [Subtercola frigoramans]MBM7471143.1 putative membrane protein [Subtercola frigoramans]